MTKHSTQGIVRKVLLTDPDMDTDEVIRQAKAAGLRAPDTKIRHAVHNLRNKVRAQVRGAKVARASARETTPSKTAPIMRAASSSRTAAASPELAGMLANVSLVNKIVELCGSIENVQQAAEAVQACGGLAAFLQHLKVVAAIRASERS